MSEHIVKPWSEPKDMTQEQALEWEWLCDSAFIKLESEPARKVGLQQRMEQIEKKFDEMGWDKSNFTPQEPAADYIAARHVIYTPPDQEDAPVEEEEAPVVVAPAPKSKPVPKVSKNQARKQARRLSEEFFPPPDTTSAPDEEEPTY
jgi:hypothetical protein